MRAAGWRRARRRFIARIVVLAIVALVVLSAALSMVGWVIGGWAGGDPANRAPRFVFGIVALLAVVGVVALARIVRGTAGPLGDLIEASARVEGGELGVTVPERGSREVRSLVRAFNAMSRRLADDDAQRRRLLADVSHELRTPLAVIQGTVEGIVDGVYPATGPSLQPILDEVRILERLVEDLRTLSLTDAGQLPLHREPADLVQLADEAVAGFAPQAAAAGVTLSSHAAGPVPPIEVDAVRIRQVLGNLIGNALRATASGGTIQVTAAHDAAAATLTVRDSGSGMAPELASRAFERFSRAPGSPGSGLGLPIVRGLVEAHGGSVQFNSTPGAGAEITVTLPA